MKTPSNLTFALVLAVTSAAAGCSGSGTMPPGDDTSPGDDVMPPGDDQPDPPTSPVGRYQLQSEFDMASGLPGTVGTIVNGFIDATDGPDDPGRYLCDLAADQLSGTWADIAHGACSLAGGYINDRLLEIAPDFVDTLVQLGNDFGQIARNFGLQSELSVTAAGATFTSNHVTTGVNFRLDGTDHIFAFAAYGMQNVTVNNVGITYDMTGHMTIAQHEIPLSYGSVLRLGVDELLVPMLDPTAANLNELFHHQVDCNQVGQAIYDAIGFGSVSTFASACDSGLDAAANLAYSQIAGLDNAAVKYQIAGDCAATDTNGDKAVDTIAHGTWTGTLEMAGQQSPLMGATFRGSRM
jgi:hypothetical protein